MGTITESALEIRGLSGSLGAEVGGISLRDTDSDDARVIHELLLQHLVLFFPDQHLTADEHLAFGRHFGELEAHPNLDFERERPEFFELRATDGNGGIADEWHSDITFDGLASPCATDGAPARSPCGTTGARSTMCSTTSWASA